MQHSTIQCSAIRFDAAHRRLLKKVKNIIQSVMLVYNSSVIKISKKNLFSNITYCTLTTNHSVITFMETWKCQGILQRSGKRHKVKGQGICVVRDI